MDLQDILDVFQTKFNEHVNLIHQEVEEARRREIEDVNHQRQQALVPQCRKQEAAR